MQVSAVEFLKSPAIYLEQASAENVHIVRDGRTIAVLAKPGDTPITDSLLGILKDSGIRSAQDIKSMRTGV